MSYNLHPYPSQWAHEPREYMSLDMDTLNPYDYKGLANKMIPYQKEQDIYYFTRQLIPISLERDAAMAAFNRQARQAGSSRYAGLL